MVEGRIFGGDFDLECGGGGEGDAFEEVEREIDGVEYGLVLYGGVLLGLSHVDRGGEPDGLAGEFSEHSGEVGVYVLVLQCYGDLAAGVVEVAEQGGRFFG